MEDWEKGLPPSLGSRMKRIDESAQWIQEDKLAEILKESYFSCSAKGIRDGKELLKFAWARCVAPSLKKGEKLTTTVAGRTAKGRLLVVNFDGYRVVQKDRALDTLLMILMKAGCRQVVMIAHDPHVDVAAAVAVDMNEQTFHQKAVGVEMSPGGKVRGLADRTLSPDDLARFFRRFGVDLAIESPIQKIIGTT
jgi:hypothetical protein